jgi:hypothetical protein
MYKFSRSVYWSNFICHVLCICDQVWYFSQTYHISFCRHWKKRTAFKFYSVYSVCKSMHVIVVCIKCICKKIPEFLIWGSASCCAFFIKIIGRTVLRNKCLRRLFIFISPLQVSALTGHLQAEYTIIFGKLPHYNGSVVFVL